MFPETSFQTETYHYCLRCCIIDICQKKSDKPINNVNTVQIYLCPAHLQSFTEDYISTFLIILPSGNRTNIIFSNVNLFPGYHLGFLDSDLRTLTQIASCPSSVISFFFQFLYKPFTVLSEIFQTFHPLYSEFYLTFYFCLPNFQ